MRADLCQAPRVCARPSDAVHRTWHRWAAAGL